MTTGSPPANPSLKAIHSRRLFHALNMRNICTVSPSENYQSYVFYGMIGAGDAMQSMFRRIERYAPTQAPVVITGETGTGKDMVARAIHRASDRRNMPYVAINCTALHEELLESELFGHERGAFTGAVKAHRGRFERAHQGTLFLDEIGDMPASVQVKLLRVLEENKFERIGGETMISVDVRVVAATNMPLEHAVGAGRFRSDLYHRLAVLRIHVPPLRSRKEDIPLLVNFFLDMLNRRYRREIRRLSPEALRFLEKYDWPGNIRELRNVLERVYVETETSIIGRNAFREWELERDYLAAGAWDMQDYDARRFARDPIVPPVRNANPWRGSPHDRQFPRPPPRALIPTHAESFDPVIEGEFQEVPGSARPSEDITPERLQSAYRKSRGNITAAARRLGIHKATFYRYMKRFNLSRKDLEASQSET